MSPEHTVVLSPRARVRLGRATLVLVPALLALMSLGSAFGVTEPGQSGEAGADAAQCSGAGQSTSVACIDPLNASSQGDAGGDGADGGSATGASGDDDDDAGGDPTAGADLQLEIVCDIYGAEPIGEHADCPETGSTEDAGAAEAQETDPASDEDEGATPVESPEPVESAQAGEPNPVSDPGGFSSDLNCGILSEFDTAQECDS